MAFPPLSTWKLARIQLLKNFGIMNREQRVEFAKVGRLNIATTFALCSITENPLTLSLWREKEAYINKKEKTLETIRNWGWCAGRLDSVAASSDLKPTMLHPSLFFHRFSPKLYNIWSTWAWWWYCWENVNEADEIWTLLIWEKRKKKLLTSKLVDGAFWKTRKNERRKKHPIGLFSSRVHLPAALSRPLKKPVFHVVVEKKKKKQRERGKGSVRQREISLFPFKPKFLA